MKTRPFVLSAARAWLDPRREDARTGALFAALAAAYWCGRSLSFGDGDSPQHVLSALTWGVSRARGQPLYTALAHAFALLPLGPAAGRVNGLSGLLHAATAALFYRLLRREGRGERAALAATALLAVSPLYWYYSEVAEPRALNDLLAVAAAWLAAGLARRGAASAWLGLGACLGLGLSSSPAGALAMPAVLLLVLPARPDARRWAELTLATAAGLVLPTLVLAMRLRWGPPPVYNPDGVKDLGGLLVLAAGGAGRSAARPDLVLLARDLKWLAQAAWSNLTPPGLLLAALGGGVCISATAARSAFGRSGSPRPAPAYSSSAASGRSSPTRTICALSCCASTSCP